MAVGLHHETTKGTGSGAKQMRCFFYGMIYRKVVRNALQGAGAYGKFSQKGRFEVKTLQIFRKEKMHLREPKPGSFAEKSME